MNENQIAAGMEAFATIVENTVIYGYEYPDYESAKLVHTEVKAEIHRLMDDGRDGVGAAAWTGKDGATESRIFVYVADTGLGLRDKIDWRGGIPYEPTEREKAALMERHVGMAVENVAAGRSKSDSHYGLGAELRRGNDIRARVGSDQ